MQITISITDPSRLTGLQRALETQNAVRNIPLTAEEFVQAMVIDQCSAFAAQYLVKTITKLAFLNRFTSDERIGIRTAAAQSPAIADYLAMLDAAQDIDLTDARTIGGVQALEDAGLIGEGRATEILAL